MAKSKSCTLIISNTLPQTDIDLFVDKNERIPLKSPSLYQLDCKVREDRLLLRNEISSGEADFW